MSKGRIAIVIIGALIGLFAIGLIIGGGGVSPVQDDVGLSAHIVGNR